MEILRNGHLGLVTTICSAIARKLLYGWGRFERMALSHIQLQVTRASFMVRFVRFKTSHVIPPLVLISRQ